jgi:hypothetical protein
VLPVPRLTSKMPPIPPPYFSLLACQSSGRLCSAGTRAWSCVKPALISDIPVIWLRWDGVEQATWWIFPCIPGTLTQDPCPHLRGWCSPNIWYWANCSTYNAPNGELPDRLLVSRLWDVILVRKFCFVSFWSMAEYHQFLENGTEGDNTKCI